MTWLKTVLPVARVTPWKEMIKKKTKQPRGQAEINHYMAKLESVRDDVDVLQHWVDQQCQFPLISKLALDMLVIPASSTPVESFFSTAGEATIGRRNRLTDSNLEKEVIIKKNKHYLQ